MSFRICLPEDCVCHVWNVYANICMFCIASRNKTILSIEDVINKIVVCHFKARIQFCNWRTHGMSMIVSYLESKSQVSFSCFLSIVGCVHLPVLWRMSEFLEFQTSFCRSWVSRLLCQSYPEIVLFFGHEQRLVLNSQVQFCSDNKPNSGIFFSLMEHSFQRTDWVIILISSFPSIVNKIQQKSCFHVSKTIR